MLPRGGGIINYQIRDDVMLHASYMPFIQGGAVFIESQRQHALGDEVFVALQLPESVERFPLSGKIVWINYRSQGHQRPAGFAIQLAGDEGKRVRHEIERRLAGALQLERPTFTI